MGLGGTRTLVKCGRAARSSQWKRADGSVEDTILIVRLSDGRAFPVSPPVLTDFMWSAPVALTCTELFAVVHEKVDGALHTNLARIKLDELGEGLPSDVDGGAP